MPKAAVLMGVHRISHAAADLQNGGLALIMGGGHRQYHGECAGGIQVVVGEDRCPRFGEIVGPTVIDRAGLAIEHDQALPSGRMPDVLALFFHFIRNGSRYLTGASITLVVPFRLI